MSRWHFDYKDQIALDDIIEILKETTVGTERPTDYTWLDLDYRSTRLEVQPVPEWFIELLDQCRIMLYDIDTDASGDGTLPDWYFDKKKETILSTIQETWSD